MAFPWDHRPRSKEARPRHDYRKRHHESSINHGGSGNTLNGRGSPMIGILPTIPEIKRISRYEANHDAGSGIAQILPADPPHVQKMMLKRKREYAAALEAQIAQKQEQRIQEERLERNADADLMGHTSPFGRPQPKHWQADSPQALNDEAPGGQIYPSSPEMMARPIDANRPIDFIGPWSQAWGMAPGQIALAPRPAAYLTPWQAPSHSPERLPGQVDHRRHDSPSPRKAAPGGGGKGETNARYNVYADGSLFDGLGAHDTPEQRAAKKEAQAELLEAQIAEKELRLKQRAEQRAQEELAREQKLQADWAEQRQRFDQEQQRQDQQRKAAAEAQVEHRRDAMVGHPGRKSASKERTESTKHLIDIDAEWRAWESRHGKQTARPSASPTSDRDDDVQVGMGRRRSNSRSATPDHSRRPTSDGPPRMPPQSRPMPPHTHPAASPPPGAPLGGSALQSALRPTIPESPVRRQDTALTPLQSRPQAFLGNMGDRLGQIQDLAVDALDEELRLIKRSCADQKARLRKQVEDLKSQASRLKTEQAKGLSSPARVWQPADLLNSPARVWQPADLLNPMGDLPRNRALGKNVSPERPFQDLRSAVSDAYSLATKSAATKAAPATAVPMSATAGDSAVESLIGTLEIAETTLIYLNSQGSGRGEGIRPTGSGHRSRSKALVTHTDSEASAGPSTAHEPWSSREGGPSQLPSSQEKWTMSEMPSSQGKWTMEESQRETQSPSGGAGSTTTEGGPSRTKLANGLENAIKEATAESNTNEAQESSDEPVSPSPLQMSLPPKIQIPVSGNSSQVAPPSQGVASGRSAISPRSETRSGQTLGDSLAYSRTNSLATSNLTADRHSENITSARGYEGSSAKNESGLNNCLDLGKALKSETTEQRDDARTDRTPPTARSREEPWSDGTIRPSSQESSGGERPASGISVDWKGCTQDILMNALIGVGDSPKRQHTIPPPLPMSRASSGNGAKVSSPGSGASPSTLAPVSEWPPQEMAAVDGAAQTSTTTPPASDRGTAHEASSPLRADAPSEAQDAQTK